MLLPVTVHHARSRILKWGGGEGFKILDLPMHLSITFVI